jgi:cell division septation protein DedD
MTTEPKLPELSSATSGTSATSSLNLEPSSGLPTFVLQVGAMAQSGNADALTASLRQKNFPAFVSKRGKDRFYRVLVGPYNGADSAMRVKNELEMQGFKSVRTEWKHPVESVEIVAQRIRSSGK